MSDTDKISPVHSLERHIQTLLLSVVCALLAWNYTTVQKGQVDIAALRAQTELLRADVSRLQVTVETSARDTYSRRDAAADKSVLEAKIEKLEARLLQVERGK